MFIRYRRWIPRLLTHSNNTSNPLLFRCSNLHPGTRGTVRRPQAGDGDPQMPSGRQPLLRDLPLDVQQFRGPDRRPGDEVYHRSYYVKTELHPGFWYGLRDVVLLGSERNWAPEVPLHLPRGHCRYVFGLSAWTCVKLLLLLFVFTYFCQFKNCRVSFAKHNWIKLTCFAIEMLLPSSNLGSFNHSSTFIRLVNKNLGTKPVNSNSCPNFLPSYTAV